MTDIVEDTKYRENYENSSDIKDNARVENINEFINSACAFVKNRGETNGLTADFLEKITMYSETDKINPDKNFVSLMTYHCAKGLEFGVVFMVGVEEEILPHYNALRAGEDVGDGEPASIEEERRLCYVGITRAKDMIFMTHAAVRYKFGDKYYPKISRFIFEAFPQYKSEVMSNIEYDELPGYLQSLKKNEFLNSEKYQNYSYSNSNKISGKYNNYNKQTIARQSRLDNIRAERNESRTLYSSSDSANANENFNYKLRAGASVLHSKFGPGKILWLSDSGDRVKISFPKIGVKLLATAVAKLKIL